MSRDDLQELLALTEAQIASLTHAVAEGEITGCECIRLQQSLEVQRREIRRLLAAGFRGRRKHAAAGVGLDSTNFREPLQVALERASGLLHSGHVVAYRPANRPIAHDFGAGGDTWNKS
jgi:hypothetical protein